MTVKFNILVIPDKRYPINHPLLEHIFADELPRRGHRITWMLQSVTTQKFGTCATWKDTVIHLNPLLSGDRRSTQIKNTFYFKLRGMLEIFRIVRQNNIDLVQVRNDLLAALFAYFACRFKKIPFVYYLAFPIQEAALENFRRGLTRSKYISLLLPKIAIPLRNWIVRKADHVFIMSEFWREKVLQELTLLPEKVTALPFGFDTSINPDQIDGTCIRQKYGLEQYPVIFYLGTIAPPRDVSILVDIMAIIIEEIPNARLLILPSLKDGRFVKGLEKKFSDKNLHQNVVFGDSVPHGQVYDHIAAADVGLSPIEPLPVYNVSSPAKFVEMLGMGCPVVASDTPEQQQVIAEWDAGICVPYDAQAFAEAVIFMLKNPEKAGAFGENGRRYVETQRSYTHLADIVENCYLQLIYPEAALC